MNKRGFELSALQGIAVAFITLAIVFSFGGTIMKNLQDDILTTLSETKDNESLVSVNQNTSTYVVSCIGQQGVTLSLTGWYNRTGGAGSGSGSAQLNTSDGTLANDGDFRISNAMAAEGFDDQDVNVTYSCIYADGETDYNSTQFGLLSISEFTSWLPTLALIIVAAVIIGIIVAYFRV